MEFNLTEIKKDVSRAICELIKEAGLEQGDILVIGCSTSEVKGSKIGKDSNEEIGEAIISEALSCLNTKGIFLAVQGCEHINRSLVVEKELAKRDKLEIVSVIPQLHAGGAASMAAYKLAKNPVMVEHIVAKAGLDIGDTSIGMHIKFVQVPVRLEVKSIGDAHLTALRSRPKLVGGARAVYE